MTRLKRVFSDPRRVDGITPLMLHHLPVRGISALRSDVRALVGDDSVWREAATQALGKIDASEGMAGFVGSIPGLDEHHSAVHRIMLSDKVSMNPVKSSFKSGTLGFELARGDSVFGRVSFDLSYDVNPYFKGAEIYRTVSPRMQGMGLSGRFREFGECFLAGLGYGYIVSLPSHPATCADVARQGWRPFPRKSANLMGKALFASNGDIKFEIDSGKEKQVAEIIREADNIPEGEVERRRNFYERCFTEAVFHKKKVHGRVKYVPDYYFRKTFFPTPKVTGLDADILGGRSLNWEQYQEELAGKARRESGFSGGDFEQDLRDFLRERMYRRML
ncbi:MAG: hypothetical protein ABH834_04170 [Candidatus Altiarchaeota archaeon]